jgi:Holliday junction resolvase-like predicted endonuclease
MKRQNFDKHLGAKNELAAVVWLLDRGYEVFRNVSPFGIIDIVAIKNGQTFLFDVKQGKIGINPSSRRLSDEQIEKGVRCLNVYPDMTCEIGMEDSPRGQIANCRNCSQQFAMTGKRTIYCSQKCCSIFYRNRSRLERAKELGIQCKTPCGEIPNQIGEMGTLIFAPTGAAIMETARTTTR